MRHGLQAAQPHTSHIQAACCLVAWLARPRLHVLLSCTHIVCPAVGLVMGYVFGVLTRLFLRFMR
jgi:hypothetical protein